MFSSRGTVRYDERGQGYRDVEKVGKHCIRLFMVFVGGTEKNHEKPHDSRRLGRDSNRHLPNANLKR